MDIQIQREELVKKIYSFRNTNDRKLIKVISGVRRCGKASLMDMYAAYLISQGIDNSQIISINFEQSRYETICEENELYNYIGGRLYPDRMNYVFLQEIRYAGNISAVIDNYSLYDNIDIYITCSDRYFIAEKMPSLLFGEYMTIHMLPLSYLEFIHYQINAKHGFNSDVEQYNKDSIPTQDLFPYYVKYGGFPYISTCLAGSLTENITAVSNFDSDINDIFSEYIQGIYNAIMVHDIVPHRQICDTSILEYVLYFVSNHLGEMLSPKKISDTMRAAGRSLNTRTVDSYLNAFAQTFILYRIQRYDIAACKPLRTIEKYYLVDISLRTALFGINNNSENEYINVGILENLVFLELLRRGFKVYIGKYGRNTISFVAFSDENSTGKNSSRKYYYVCESISDEATLKNILKIYRTVKDNYPKYIISNDSNSGDYDGIKHINIKNFLSEDFETTG